MARSFMDVREDRKDVLISCGHMNTIHRIHSPIHDHLCNHCQDHRWKLLIQDIETHGDPKAAIMSNRDVHVD